MNIDIFWIGNLFIMFPDEYVLLWRKLQATVRSKAGWEFKKHQCQRSLQALKSLIITEVKKQIKSLLICLYPQSRFFPHWPFELGDIKHHYEMWDSDFRLSSIYSMRNFYIWDFRSKQTP